MITRILDPGQDIGVTVGTTSTLVLGKNTKRGYCTIVNDSNETVYLAFGHPAVLHQGTPLNPKGGATSIGEGADNYFDEVYAICASGNKVLCVTELDTR